MTESKNLRIKRKVNQTEPNQNKKKNTVKEN